MKKRKRKTGQKSVKRKPKKKGPPKGTGKWRNRRRPRGERARIILRRLRNKGKESDIRTAVRLAKKEEMSESEFVNFVMTLDLTGKEAYTFWYSPP